MLRTTRPPETMQPPRDDGVDGHPHAPPFLRENELRRRHLRHVGPDRPALVVQVEVRNHRHQVHVGFVVGVDRPHVAPVLHRLVVEVDEIVRHHARLPDGLRNDVPAEVVRGVRVLGVFHQRVHHHFRVEHVHAHRGAHHARVENRPDRVSVLRLLLEALDQVVLADLHHAEAAGFLGRHLDGGQRDVRLVLTGARRSSRDSSSCRCGRPRESGNAPGLPPSGSGCSGRPRPPFPGTSRRGRASWAGSSRRIRPARARGSSSRRECAGSAPALCTA